jgi:thiamine biosynthesis lipoprotein
VSATALAALAAAVGVALGGNATARPASGTRPDDDPRRFEFAERHMGTTFRIVVYAPDTATAAAGAAAAFAVIGGLDRRFSDYDPGSEVSRLGEVAGEKAGRKVSPELREILGIARRWSARTGGAFDVTVGPLTRLWRWSARRGELPDSARLERARAAVGWKSLEIDEAAGVVRLTRPGMAIDLGGIAKGYAADAALAELARRGLPSALVDAGGDIAVGEAPPGEPGWRVAVDGGAGPEAAAETAEETLVLAGAEDMVYTLILADTGIATSGDRFRYFEADGVRYSHIVDPRTGLGVTRPKAVTVIAPDATTADVLASALSVLAEARGRALVASVPGARMIETAGTDTLTTERKR